MVNKIRTVGIVDYGVGNHASLIGVISSLGFKVQVSHIKEELNSADILILPGVGAFPYAINRMRHHNLIQCVKSFAKKGKLIIGICLGMQILADNSTEGGSSIGLSLIPGKVIPFGSGQTHIGWSGIEARLATTNKNKYYNKEYYFNHSFRFVTSHDYIDADCHFGETFPAIIRNKNIIGLQFHPEKSQHNGREILKSILQGDYFV